MPVVTVKPVTRVEGHLELEATVEPVGGVPQVVEARSSGTMFRGFEALLVGRDPRDATHLTQRICGVCPISHGMASSLCLEDAFGQTPPEAGRVLRNLVLAANYLQSHVLHFYHLAALDYVDTTGILDLSPWTPRPTSPDMLRGAAAAPFVDHYVQALQIRRQAHQMGSVFGGKMPCSPTIVAGGCTEQVTAAKVAEYRALLATVSAFVRDVYLPDVQAVAANFPAWSDLGRGCGNLLAFGVFDLVANGSRKLLARGRFTEGAYGAVDEAQIGEDTRSSFYADATSGLAPAVGQTTPQAGKAGAYSWIKAPRYGGKVHEVGPLARMWVNGDYRVGISVIDRHAARALEAQKVAAAAATWLDQLSAGASAYALAPTPAAGSGSGLTEAPRGALGHWMDLRNGAVARYQIVTPTAWNASPRDDAGQPGPLEQALVGTPVADAANPIELLRVVHSFDPCLSCSVHVARAGRRFGKVIIRG